MKFEKLFLFTVAFFITSFTAHADKIPPSKIMVVGVFHFANPGLDSVKAKQVDITLDENQVYLEALARRFAEFKPTHVLLECSPSESAEYLQKYKHFIQDGQLTGTNENYQLGFRIAKTAGLASTECYDEREVGWDSKQLFLELEKKEPEIKKAFDQEIASITAQTNENHKTLTLAELLKLTNDPEQDRLNKNLYLLTNSVGAGKSFSGADAAASWWHRNFRMYANIQKIAQPGTRVIVLGGQGHTAVLKDFIKLDSLREGIESRPFF